MKAVFLFELSRQLRKPFTYIMWLLLFVQAIYYVFHAGEFFVTDGAPYNSPVMLYTLLAGVGYVSFVVYAILGAQVLNKDLEYKTAALLYTSSVSESGYFWGNFLAVFSTLLIIMSGHLLGTFGFQYMGLVPPDRLMELPFSVIWEGIFVMFLPNVFFMFILSFSLATITKKNVGAYMAMVIAMMLMIFGDTNAHQVPFLTLFDLAGFSELHRQIDLMNTEAKINYRFSYDDMLFWNRLFWLGVSSLLLFISRKKFTFKKYIYTGKRKSKFTKDDTIQTATPTMQQPSVAQQFRWTDMWGMARMHFFNEVRSVRFYIFSGMIMLLYILYVLIYQQQYYSASPTLPTTVYILNTISPLIVFVYLYFLVITTELLFKDRTQQFWQISDALPVSTTRYIAAKVLAMAGVALLTASLFIMIGLIIQTAKGYYNYELVVYFRNLLGYRFPLMCLFVLLPVLFAAITNNRYLTHVLNLVFIFSTFIFHELEIFEQQKFLYSFTPLGSSTTAMNGTGIFSNATTWFVLYWISLTIAAILLVFPLLQRGTLLSAKQNLFRYSKKWNGRLVFGFAACLLIFVCSAWVVYDNINVRNAYQSKDAENRDAAAYEKKYKQFEYSLQPKLVGYQAALDLYPDTRKATCKAELLLVNKTESAIDSLHVEWMDFAEVKSLQSNSHSLKAIQENAEFRHTIYSISPALLPGDSITIQYEALLQYSGFTNHDPQPALAYNGSFLHKEIFPFFGYNRERELKENRHRVELGLEKLNNRLPAIDDRKATGNSYASPDADRISGTMTVSTNKDQVIVTSGTLLSEKEENDRRYYSYQIENGLYDFYVLSARYAVHKQPLPVKGRSITVEIYYHPADSRNIDFITAVTEKTLQFLQDQLGSYPFDVIRIAEKPAYDEDLIAFGNVLVLPDNHVWNADARKVEDMDYAGFAITKLMATQYWQQGNYSAVQGYPLFTNSLPDYYALRFLQTQTDSTAFAKHLEKRKQNYFKSRALEANAEPALIAADDEADYVFNEKGGYAFYQLAQKWNQSSLDTVLHSWYQESLTAPQKLNAIDFSKKLEAVLPDSVQPYFIKAFKETGELFK